MHFLRTIPVTVFEKSKPQVLEMVYNLYSGIIYKEIEMCSSSLFEDHSLCFICIIFSRSDSNECNVSGDVAKSTWSSTNNIRNNFSSLIVKIFCKSKWCSLGLKSHTWIIYKVNI